jgi:hypothetical protein
MKLKHWVVMEEAGEAGSTGGGTSSPAPAEGSSNGEGSSVDWEALNENVAPGNDDEGEEGSATPSPTPAAPGAAPTPTPTPQPPTPGPTPAEPEAGAEAPPPVLPAEPNAPPVLTPEQIAAQQAEYDKWEQAQLANFEKAYAFDEDAAARLQSEPEVELPKLAARLHMQITKQVLEGVQRIIPQLVPGVLQSQNTEKAATDMFFGANPDLKAHQQDVLVAGQMFRKMNPKATPEEAVVKIGEMVRAAKGLPPLEKGAATPTPTPAGRTQPHKPVAPGAGGKPAPAAKPSVKPGEPDWGDLASDD